MTRGKESDGLSEHGVEVRRLPWRRWYLAVIGIVMVLHGGGILFGWYPTVRTLELMYPGREAPGFESRDMAWAAAFLVVGALLIVVTAARVAVRRPVVRAGEAGILLSVGGPFTRPVSVPWGHVREISVGEEVNEFGASPSLLLRIDDPVLVGGSPWSARWNDGVLSVPAEEWDRRVDEVAEQLEEARESFASDVESGSPLPSGESEQEANPGRATGSEPEGSSKASEGADAGEVSDDEPSVADPAPISERVPE